MKVIRFWGGLLTCVYVIFGQSSHLPGGLPAFDILLPEQGTRLTSIPVRVQVKFNFPVRKASFRCYLNGQDVTQRFMLASDNASANLNPSDGLRLNIGAKAQSFAPNLLRITATAENTNRNFQAVRQFFINAPDDPIAVGTVPPEGGSVSLPSIATVIFPPGAFLFDQGVEIAPTSDPETSAVFEETAILFAPGPRVSYEVRIRTGNTQPLTDSVVVFEIPEAFKLSLPPEAEIRVFGQNFWQGEDGETLDTFELLPERFVASDTVASVTLSPSLFSSARTITGVYEAVLVLGTTPTAQVNANSLTAAHVVITPEGNLAEEHIGNPTDAFIELDTSNERMLFLLAAAADTCEGTTLLPPLDGDLTITSPFGGRVHPVTGNTSHHYGTDYRAADGTPVRAMHGGTVEYVNVQRDRTTGSVTGWGQYVVVNGPAGRTLYAHLQIGSPSFSQGQQVQAGQVIGLSGNSGTGTGPHLHVEYAPNGSIFERDNKVNPAPCVDRNVSGSITVCDNGSLADDAFTVSINGQVVCQTQIGASNTCGIGNLRPGTATLSITAVIAPDNVGTYEISLAEGLTFVGGGTVRSGTLPQGGTASFTINIPSQ